MLMIKTIIDEEIVVPHPRLINHLYFVINAFYRLQSLINILTAHTGSRELV